MVPVAVADVEVTYDYRGPEERVVIDGDVESVMKTTASILRASRAVVNVIDVNGFVRVKRHCDADYVPAYVRDWL